MRSRKMPHSQRSLPSSAGLVEASFKRSRLLIAAASAIYLAAALPALLVPLPLALRLGWLFGVLVPWAAWLLRKPCTAIRQLPDGRWRLSLPDREIDAELRSWYVHPWCCVALFRAGWRFRRAVVIPAWAVDSEVHRRLRVALRLTAGR